MPHIWIDPPTGYLFGFPKIVHVDQIDEYTDWDQVLIANGYPAHERDSLPLRMWEATEDDIVNMATSSLTTPRKIP